MWRKKWRKIIKQPNISLTSFPGGSDGKESACDAGCAPALAGGFFSTEPPVMYTNVKIHRMGHLRGIFLYVNYLIHN